MFCDVEVCAICSDSSRNTSGIICIVETISDCIAIEKSDEYRGMFHILGGVLNPLMGIGPDELNVDKLLARVKTENIEALILAINPSVEGDATCSYLKQVMPTTVKIDRIGFGIPMGGCLEHLDSMTINKALENRKTM